VALHLPVEELHNVGLHHAYGVGTNSGQGNFFYNRATKKAERASTQYEYPQGSACFRRKSSV
jgi:ribonucleoside-diphosphate reductase alpha chain